MNPKFAPWLRYYQKAGDDDAGGGGNDDGKGGGGLLSDHKVEGDDDDDGKKEGDDAGGAGDDGGKRPGDDEDAAKAKAAAAAVSPLHFEARPDHVPENFWKKDEEGDGGLIDLEALTKSHKDLRSRQATKGKPPAKPEDYTFEFTSPVEGMDIKGDDMLVTAFRQVAFDEGMPQEQFNRIAGKYSTALINFMKGRIDAGEMEQYDQGAELKKLGENGKPLMDGVKGWLKGLMTRGLLSEGQFKRLMTSGDYADGVTGFAVLRSLSGEVPIPLGMPLEGEGMPSDEDLYARVGDERYREGTAFYKETELLFQKRWGRSAAGASPAGLGVSTRPQPAEKGKGK